MIDRDTKLDRDSILVSVKKIVGIDKDYDQFENDIIMDTNTVLFGLVQMGIGREDFELEDASQTWNEFLTDKQVNLKAVKTWVGLNVKLLFDPPTNSTQLQAIKDEIKKYEWRMYITENYTDEDFDKNYYGKEFISDAGIVNGAVKQVGQYLFEVEYSNLDYDYAEKYFNAKNLGIRFGGCSSVRNGNWYGRNLDWVYSNQAEFIVHTSNTIGIAGQINELTKDFVKSGKYSELYKLVPFMIVDGINKHGLVCNTNVVPTDKGNTTGTTPLIETKERFCSLMLPRFILDNFSTARGAITYLENYVSVYASKAAQKMGFDTHFMVADMNNTYLIEFINNEMSVREISSKPYMTNFHLIGTIFNQNGKVYTPADVEDGHSPSVENNITPHGSGLERYNLIVDNYQNTNSKEGMMEMMKKLFYTNAYKNSTNPYWFTEFVGNRNLTINSTPEEFMPVVSIVQEVFRNRRREGNPIDIWQTNHSSVYDIENKCLYLISQEYDNDIYEIKI